MSGLYGDWESEQLSELAIVEQATIVRGDLSGKQNIN